MSNIVRVATLPTLNSIVDGPGIRTVVWFQGCPHACIGCHNQNTHAFDGGFTMTLDEIIDLIDKQPWNGVTISGGEPFIQSEVLLSLVKSLHSKGKNIWIYTGFTMEQLLDQMPLAKEIIRYADRLVEGPYIQALKDTELEFRGSSNQRILDLNEFTPWNTQSIMK